MEIIQFKDLHPNKVEQINPEYSPLIHAAQHRHNAKKKSSS